MTLKEVISQNRYLNLENYPIITSLTIGAANFQYCCCYFSSSSYLLPACFLQWDPYSIVPPEEVFLPNLPNSET